MADDKKKDLTSIVDLAKNVADDRIHIQDIPPETIEEFESLDDYARNNPLPDPSVEPVAVVEPPDLPSEPDSNLDLPPALETDSTPDSPPEFETDSTPDSPPEFETDFTPDSPPEFETDFTPDSPPEFETDFTPDSPPEFETDFTPDSPPEFETDSIPDSPPESEPAFEPVSEPPASMMDQIRETSDRMPAVKTSVPASFPFSLRIHGLLNDLEKEKLVDLVTRHQMGISEEELEPQLESNQILIPRISEYAGILLIQALRDTRATIQFGPSESIYSTEATREEDEGGFLPGQSNASVHVGTPSHPAEDLPVSTDGKLPGLNDFKIIDAITVSASIKASVVEAQSSTQYQETVEALQRELKYKAFRRGASSVLSFNVSLAALSDSPTHYRLTVKGTAVRPYHPGENRPWDTSAVAIEAESEEDLARETDDALNPPGLPPTSEAIEDLPELEIPPLPDLESERD